MDYFLFQKINSLAGNWACLDALGIFFAKYFAYILIILVPLFFWRKRKAILEAFLAGILARYGIVELMRWLWPRPRPPALLEKGGTTVNLLIDKINQAAFPSGHAAFCFALSTVVYFYNKKAGIGFYIISFLISISRIFVGVHWPSDILAGALVGIFSGWLIMRIFRK